MTDLTLEHCKNLAAWGMPQRVGKGSWVWWTGEIDKHFKGRPLLHGVDVVQIMLDTCPSDWILTPSLDALLEFVRGFYAPDFVKVSLHGDSHGQYYAELNVQTGTDVRGTRILTGYGSTPTPKLAVYKLIEKLMEVERGT